MAQNSPNAGREKKQAEVISLGRDLFGLLRRRSKDGDKIKERQRCADRDGNPTYSRDFPSYGFHLPLLGYFQKLRLLGGKHGTQAAWTIDTPVTDREQKIFLRKNPGVSP